MSSFNYHLSDAHVSLQGLKGIIDVLIKQVDEKKDRKKLYGVRKPCFLLCDQVAGLFDQLEVILCEKSYHHDEATAKLDGKLEEFYSQLWSNVTGSMGPIRSVAGNFLETIKEVSDDANYIIDYLIALDELVGAIKDTADELKKLKTDIEDAMTDYKQDVLGI